MKETNKNDWYPVGVWLQANDLKMTLSLWKKSGKIPHSQKLGICYVTGETYDSLFGGI